MKSKYVIVEIAALELPIVFNPLFDHAEIAGSHKVVSAGFCHVCENTGNYSVWGKSVSLKLESRPEDADILDNWLEKDV